MNSSPSFVCCFQEDKKQNSKVNWNIFFFHSKESEVFSLFSLCTQVSQYLGGGFEESNKSDSSVLSTDQARQMATLSRTQKILRQQDEYMCSSRACNPTICQPKSYWRKTHKDCVHLLWRIVKRGSLDHLQYREGLLPCTWLHGV